MSDASKAVFLSYASQDAEAAKRICEALRASGVEVWFDQSELVGGDQWDAKIRGQIGSCALFVPLISANTQARREGYFRLEWKLAAQRTHMMSERTAFLLPVIIDATRDAEADVPGEFRAVQFTKLPGGETPAKFTERVKRLLGGSEMEAGHPRPSERKEVTALAGKTGLAKWWWALPIFGVTMALVLVMKESRKDPAPPPTVVSTPVIAPLTEAQKLVAQARKIYEEGDELDRETLILADDLVKRAIALDAAEPAAWLLGAQLSYTMVWQSFDKTETRKAELQRQAARARALAPESVAARLAAANARLAVAYDNYQSDSNRQDLADVEKELLRLAAQQPDDFQIHRALGQTYRFLRRPDEALAALQRALELSGGDPSVTVDVINVTLRRKRYAEAEALVAPTLARRPIGRLLVFDVMFKLQWRGDLPAAQAALAAWPGWLLREDRGAFIAWQTWLWSRQPARALEVAQRLPRDYLRDVWFTGPRAVLTARAHELAGNREAALVDWRTTVRLADQELAGEPGDIAALFWKAWALGRLGDQAGAEAAATLLRQHMTTQTTFFKSTSSALLWATIGRTDLAFDQLRSGFVADDDAYAVTRTMLELDPAYAPLRDDPRFKEIVQLALAPTVKPEDRGQKTEGSVSIDQKSVAVLAFANLSDNKANEYFSDGISEELLNVLAKVPGLKVSARTSAFYFKGKEVPIPEIAKQLGVAYVVEGSVRKQGDKVRITAQLIKATDGFHVWSDTFTRDLKDIFAVQDEIAGLIAQNLELKMGFSQAGARGAISPAAYQEYLAGRAAFAKSGMMDLREAVTHFEHAVALEPKFTAAWVQLASAHTRLGRWGGAPTLASWLAARAAIDRAKALEPDSPEVLLALGWILRTADWNWRDAEKAFRRVLELQPNQPDALAGAAVLLFNIGKQEEAYRLGRQAVQLDPLNPATHIDLSIMFYLNQNWAEAEQAARRALQLAPGGSSYHSLLAWSLIAQQRYSEAEAEIYLDSAGIDQTNALGILAIARGQGAVARERMAQLEEIARTQPDSADLQHSIAWIATGLGEKDRAFAALGKARDSRDPSMSWLRNTPYLRSLYSDPRWDALLHQVGLADDQLK